MSAGYGASPQQVVTSQLYYVCGVKSCLFKVLVLVFRFSKREGFNIPANLSRGFQSRNGQHQRQRKASLYWQTDLGMAQQASDVAPRKETASKQWRV